MKYKNDIIHGESMEVAGGSLAISRQRDEEKDKWYGLIITDAHNGEMIVENDEWIIATLFPLLRDKKYKEAIKSLCDENCKGKEEMKMLRTLLLTADELGWFDDIMKKYCK